MILGPVVPNEKIHCLSHLPTPSSGSLRENHRRPNQAVLTPQQDGHDIPAAINSPGRPTRGTICVQDLKVQGAGVLTRRRLPGIESAGKADPITLIRGGVMVTGPEPSAPEESVTAEAVELSELRAGEARERAAHAGLSAARSFEESARLHDQVAQMPDQTVEQGASHPDVHRAAAKKHRTAATANPQRVRALRRRRTPLGRLAQRTSV